MNYNCGEKFQINDGETCNREISNKLWQLETEQSPESLPFIGSKTFMCREKSAEMKEELYYICASSTCSSLVIQNDSICENKNGRR